MSKEKNVLLITYYWPPSGGAGVHRWLRFSRYFKENGVNLTVYCPDNAAWPVIDPALEKQVPKDITVIRRKIFEPNKYLSKSGSVGTGFTQNKKAGAVKKFMIWARGNFFIPDSRVFWIKPSTRFLSAYLNDHPEITTVISSGPPHSMHIIASNLVKKYNLKWIADFRDPWTQIDFYKDLLPGKRADIKQKRLEKMVLTQADKVVTVSNACAEGLEEIGKRKIDVITNGYIFADFDPKSIELDKKFSIVHFGTMPFARNPQALWQALSDLLKENNNLADHLEIKLIGAADYQVMEAAKNLGLEEYVTSLPLVQHSESIEMQRKAQILLLSANNAGNVKGILTGKFFEYLGAKRPVVAIGQKDSDLHAAMTHTEAGCFVDFEDANTLKKYLQNSFDEFLTDGLFNEAKNIDVYSSAVLAKKFVDLI